MTTEDVANKLVELCDKGDYEGATKSLYGEDIVSVEPHAMGDIPARRSRALTRSAKRRSGGWKITRCTARRPLAHSWRAISSSCASTST